MTAPALFSRCPLPGCRNLTEDPREPCEECVALFGPRLRRSGREVTAEAFAAEIAEGDRRVAEIYAERRRMVPLEELHDSYDEVAAAMAGED